MRPTALKFLILAASLAIPSLAGEYDEPGRGVARISLINGDVSVRRGDSGDLVAAAINAPLVVEDHVLTGPGSRAEVQFDWANMIRLDSNSEIRLAELEYNRYIIQVATGRVTFSVLRDTDADVEISTPSVSVRPVQKGDYRITVRPDGESEITVRFGEAEIFTPTGSQRLKPGRTMIARGTVSNPEYQLVAEIPEDNWDRWNRSRDSYVARSKSYEYVDHSIYGAEDLDHYGRWAYIPPYGWCWYPAVAASWAPYNYGRWAWVDWYGWSWVSYDPWGWAPFHYGRWFYHRPYGWCWYPGYRHVRHYWRPALVAFFGWGSHSGFRVGIGVGFGNVGWVPLAPYEPYYPWYGRRYYRGYRANTYIDNSVHIVNNTNITNIYRNARIANAVTAVNGSQFARGGGGNLVRVRADQLRRANLVKGQLPVAPDREALRLTNRHMATVNLPRNQERFFSRRTPAQVDRVPFEAQRRSLEQVSRRTFGQPSASIPARVARTEQVREAAGREIQRPPGGNIARTSPDNRNSSGWRRVGEAPATQAQGRESSQGWRRFGEPIQRPATPVRNGTSPAQERGSGQAGSVRSRAPQEKSTGWRQLNEPARNSEQPAGVIRREQINRGRQEAPAAQAQGGESSQGWRRFGEPIQRPATSVRNGTSPVQERGSDPAGSVRSRTPQENSGEWRRFNEPTRNTAQELSNRGRQQVPADRGSVRQESSGWQRFEPGRGSEQGTRSSGISRDRFSRSTGSPSFGSPRVNSPRSGRMGRESSIRISPPIVRERTTPRFEGSRGGATGSRQSQGGGVIRSAPHGGGSVRSAPRSNGGDRVSRGGGRSGRNR
jgi:hypothetical protein